MAERQIGHRKSSLVVFARFPVVKWRSRSVAKSAYCNWSTQDSAFVFWCVTSEDITPFWCHKVFLHSDYSSEHMREGNMHDPFCDVDDLGYAKLMLHNFCVKNESDFILGDLGAVGSWEKAGRKFSCTYLKTFVPLFLPTQLTARGSPRSII